MGTSGLLAGRVSEASEAQRQRCPRALDSSREQAAIRPQAPDPTS